MKSEKWQPLRLQTNPETEFRFSHKLAHNYIFTTAGFEERSGDQGLELSLERSGLIPLEPVQGDTERGCQDLSHQVLNKIVSNTQGSFYIKKGERNATNT